MNKYLETRKQHCKFDKELKENLICHFHIDVTLDKEKLNKISAYICKNYWNYLFTTKSFNKKSNRISLVGYGNLIDIERLDNRLQVISGYTHHLEFKYYKDLGLQAWSI